MSSFDIFYRRMVSNPFFSKGWGSPDLILQLLESVPKVSDRNFIKNLNKYAYPIKIIKEENTKDVRVIEGSFESPLNTLIPGALEGTNKISQFQMIIPTKWKTNHKPICFHYSGTGDHYYARRRIFLANKLLEDGIGSLIVMNPFYSDRKPVSQNKSSLNFLTDLFVMGGALMGETHALINWCDQQGYGPYALHGISMGGFMASLCAQASHRIISLIPCLSAITASCVFVDGVLARSVDWESLTRQYYEDKVFSKIIRPKLQPSVLPQYVTPSPSADKEVIEERLLRNEQAIRQEILRDASKGNSEDSNVPSNNPSLDVSTWRYLDLNRLWMNLPSPASGWGLDYSSWINILRQNDPPVQDTIDPEVREFMREMLDRFTHLGNFPPLESSSLVCAVLAEWDAYVPSTGVAPLNSVYPNAEIRYLPQAGHVGAYLRNAIWTHDFRNAICDSLNRQIELKSRMRGECEKGPFGISRMSQKTKKDTNQTKTRKVMGISFGKQTKENYKMKIKMSPVLKKDVDSKLVTLSKSNPKLTTNRGKCETNSVAMQAKTPNSND